MPNDFYQMTTIGDKGTFIKVQPLVIKALLSNDNHRKKGALLSNDNGR